MTLISAPTHPASAARTLSSVQGTLALEFPRPPQPPVPRTRALSLVPAGHTELDAFAGRFAQAVVEVIGGDRGPAQLLRWTSEQVYADLVARCAVLQQATPSDRRRRRLRAQVRSVRLFCPSPEAAEVSVHVRHGQRSRAFAARLERVGERWCCTALELG